MCINYDFWLYGFHKSKLLLIPVSCFQIFSKQWFFLLLNSYAIGFKYIVSSCWLVDWFVIVFSLSLSSLRFLE